MNTRLSESISKSIFGLPCGVVVVGSIIKYEYLLDIIGIVMKERTGSKRIVIPGIGGSSQSDGYVQSSQFSYIYILQLK